MSPKAKATEKDEKLVEDELDEGAPELESPESPKAPPKVFGDIAPGPVEAPDTPPTDESPQDAVPMDTGTGSSMAPRPDAFSPVVVVTETSTVDPGLGSTPVTRPNVFVPG